MKRIFSLIFIFLLGSVIWAQSYSQTEDLMKIGVGARPMGMGKAFVALADDGNSPFMNPAGLAELKSWQLTSMYVNYLEGDVPYTLLSGSWPWRAGTIGLGLLSTGVSDIPSPTPTSISYFDYYDRMLLLSYAQRYTGPDILSDPNKDLLFGGNLKLLFKGMGGAGGNAGRGYDVDLGVKYTHNKWLKLGANFQNILATTLDWNSQAKEDIPLLLKVGGALKLWNERLNLALDMDLPLGANLPNLYHLGLEWPINSIFCLRAGADQISDAASAVATNPTAGASINYRGFKVDYAYHPYQGTLNDLAHYFSFSFAPEAAAKPLFTVNEPPDRSTVRTESIPVSVSVDDPRVKKVSINKQWFEIKDQKVVVAPVDLKLGKNRIDLQFYDEKGALINKKSLRILRFVNYPDVPDDHWASEAIGAVGTLGIVKCYPAGDFRPEGLITRAEMVACLARVKYPDESKLPPVDQQHFVDIPADHWAAKYVNFANDNDLVYGYPDDTFQPDNHITRAEGITILARFSDLKPLIAPEPIYQDVPVGHWASEMIAAAKKAGMLYNYRNLMQLEPHRYLTRAEAIDILYRSNMVKSQRDEMLDLDRD